MPMNSPLNGYRPTAENKEYTDRMDRAGATNRKRDQVDANCGMILARDRGPAVYLLQAMSAIETGLKCDDWDYVAQGLAMLQDLRERYAVVLGGRRGPRQSTSIL